MAPEERIRNPGERPLYLCVQASCEDSVNKAIHRIHEIIDSNSKTKTTLKFTTLQQAPLVAAAPPSSVSPLRPRLPGETTPPPLMSINTQPPGNALQVPVVQDKVFIGLEHAPPSFDVKGKVAGPMGSFLNHIQQETGAKVTLRGKGSGTVEAASGHEAFEGMYVHLQHTHILGLTQAKQLATNLIETVQQDYAQFQQTLATLPPSGPLVGSASTPAAGPLQQQTLPHQQQAQHQTAFGMPVITQAPPVIHTTVSALPPHSVAPLSPTQILPAQGVRQMYVNTSIPPPSLMTQPPPISSQPDMTLVSISAFTRPVVSEGGLLQQPPPSHISIQPPTMAHQFQPAQVQYSEPQSQPPPQMQVRPPFITSQAAPVEQTVYMQPHVQLAASKAVAPPTSQEYYTHYVGGGVASSASETQIQASSIQAQALKRRFTEEKFEEKLPPENLLGYQHGPPHLANLVTSHKAPYDERLQQQQNGARPSMPPPPPPPLGSIKGQGQTLDKQLMPPPPPPPGHAGDGLPDAKKMKPNMIAARETDKYTQYTSKAQLYSQQQQQPQEPYSCSSYEVVSHSNTGHVYVQASTATSQQPQFTADEVYSQPLEQAPKVVYSYSYQNTERPPDPPAYLPAASGTTSTVVSSVLAAPPPPPPPPPEEVDPHLYPALQGAPPPPPAPYPPHMHPLPHGPPPPPPPHHYHGPYPPGPPGYMPGPPPPPYGGPPPPQYAMPPSPFW
ncbi:hypothetical protein CAPTEDRAFT_219908 [Capitella teleta]|uniref:KH homology domain-containing protein 4 n=1 Tax=Capitella teleta TaxID=283909 RepID=R7UIX2_CAPTE|nr:hypothetical protein CAPTEDRAFT_219908 [Capitella teleta]|eukprot:ELU06038.1 hypothetical protein CAPTEDRAFT_219908 [Capitella teleta]